MLATVPLLFSLNQLTLSEHVSVNCLLPFVTAFAGWFWLGERFTKTQAICCSESPSNASGAMLIILVICIIGLMMVVDPFRTRNSAALHEGRDDGIPDTLSVKLLGVSASLLGVLLRAPQCESGLIVKIQC
jgi:hypothetical protein